MFGYRGFSRQGGRFSHKFRASSSLVELAARGRTIAAPLITGLIGGGVIASYASSRTAQEKSQKGSTSTELDWVKEIEGRSMETGHSGALLRDNPVGRKVFDDDHLFDSLLETGQVSEYRGFYDKKKKEFYAVISLGPRTSGYPNTTHGGMTAALLDDTFGGLGGSLWKAGALGFRPPAYTARLEIDYKKKIPSGSTILVSAQVESMVDRKIWMSAQVSDGKSTVYATGRALFIAPRISSIFSWIPGLGRLIGGSSGKQGSQS